MCYIVSLPILDTTVVSEHNLGLDCAFSANMSSEEGDPLTNKEKRYLKIINWRYDYIDDREDKGKTPLSGGEEEEYPKLLLQTIQDIAREIKDMRMDRHKESPKGFLHGEGSDISHHWKDRLVKQYVSQRSTMPTFSPVGNGGFQEQETPKEYFMKYESQSQRFKDHLSFQEFFQIKDNRIPSHHNRGGGFI